MNTPYLWSYMDIEKMCAEARKRLAEFINRSAGQHLRAMKPPAPKKESKA